MNPFVAYMQYLASVEEHTAANHIILSPASITHDVPSDEAYESDGGESSPSCSPLILPSPSLPEDLLDFSTQWVAPSPSKNSVSSSSVQSPSWGLHLGVSPHSGADTSPLISPTPGSCHPEGPAASALFQSRSAFADASPSFECLQVDSCHPHNQPLSDPCCHPSFESLVHTLAEDALLLAPTVKSFNRGLRNYAHIQTSLFVQDLPKGDAPIEVLQQESALLMDAKEAVTLRRAVVLTAIGFHIEEIRSKLRVYNKDGDSLTVITDKIRQTEAQVQNQNDVPLDFASLSDHHRSSRHGRLSFLQRNGPLLSQMQPMLDATKRLRREAVIFVTDHVSFQWNLKRRHSDTRAS